MEAKLIDLNDYTISGAGAVGESFNHNSDPSVMLKLYRAEKPRESIEQELLFAQRVFNTGIPTPEPGEFVTDGNGRYGMKFQRIVGKKSYSRACSDNPELIEPLAREFAQLCRQLHDTHLAHGEFPDVKDEYIKMLIANQLFTSDEKERIEQFILGGPEGDSALHGDLQFSNAIRVQGGQEVQGVQGVQEVQKYFIDLGDFTIGHPYFDLGQVLLCCMYEDEEFSQEVFHLTCAQGAEFWHWFVKGYWDDDADPAEWQKVLAPYAGLKVLMIEREFPDFKIEKYHRLLLDNI